MTAQNLHVAPWPSDSTPESFTKWVDTHLESFLESALDASLGRTPTTHPPYAAPENLRECIRYSLLAPGKRIRPRLALATGMMLQLPPTAALAAGCAIEMIHCFSLIHDDLPCMDDDDFRRGRPSNHKVYGEGLALLSGDALMACASDTLLLSAQAGIAPAHVLGAIKRFNWASGPQGVIGGQAMEPLLADQPSLGFLERMFAGKTGALFVASLMLPLDLAGISENSREGGVIASFARELGYAFQVADDLEDALEPGSREHEKPHSIIYHISPPEAARRTHARLARATDDLRTVHGARAAHLASISGEVLKKLDRYQNT